MKNKIILMVFLMASQSINAQIDTSRIIDYCWRSIKMEGNGKTFDLDESQRNYMIFHSNGFYSFVFAISDLKNRVNDACWKYIGDSQSFLVTNCKESNTEKRILKVISVTDSSLILQPFSPKNVIRIYCRKVKDYKK